MWGAWHHSRRGDRPVEGLLGGQSHGEGVRRTPLLPPQAGRRVQGDEGAQAVPDATADAACRVTRERRLCTDATADAGSTAPFVRGHAGACKPAEF